MCSVGRGETRMIIELCVYVYRSVDRKHIPTPYILRGTFRIRSVYDAVTFLHDMIARAAETPELVADTLELQGTLAEENAPHVPTSPWKMNRVRAMSIKPFAGLPEEFTKLPSTRPALGGAASVGGGRRSSRVVPASGRRPSVGGPKSVAQTPVTAAVPGRSVSRKQSVIGGGKVLNSEVVTVPLRRGPRRGSLITALPNVPVVTPSASTATTPLNTDVTLKFTTPEVSLTPTFPEGTLPRVLDDGAVQTLCGTDETHQRSPHELTVTISKNVFDTDGSSSSSSSAASADDLMASVPFMAKPLPGEDVSVIPSQSYGSVIPDGKPLSNQEEGAPLSVLSEAEVETTHRLPDATATITNGADVQRIDKAHIGGREAADENDEYESDFDNYEDDFEECDDEAVVASSAVAPRRPSEPKPSSASARARRIVHQ